MNKFFKIFYKHKITILISSFSILILLLLYQLYGIFFGYYIIAKFSESGPLYVNMPVYYKGYKIGRVEKIKLSSDYKYTLVKMALYPKDPKLPDDVVAKAKKPGDEKNYIDLVVSDEPSTTLLKNGGIIDGEPAFDMETFLSDVATADIVVPLLQHFSDLLVNAGKTSDEVRNFFIDSRSILKDNKQNLKQTTRDLAVSTKSFVNITSKFDNSLSKDKLNNTTSSLDKSSANVLSATESIKNIAQNVDCATRNIDKTMETIDSTISEANAIASHVEVITRGFCETLGKRFAGLRIIFGKPINNNKCQCRKNGRNIYNRAKNQN